jgi:hypothetical protein
MVARILRDDQDRDGWIKFLRNHPLPMTVSAIKGARRSLPQNATAAAWYGQIAQAYSMAQGEAKAECKLRFGLPIMDRDRPDWVESWQPLYGPLPYAMQRKLFEVIPMTSLFTTKQMAEYMTAIQREYVSQGVALIDPEARKYENLATLERN